MKLDVRHGALLDVLGPPVVAGGITLLAARVELESEESGSYLRDHAGAMAAVEAALAIRGGFEAAWVRARLPRAFGVTPARAAEARAEVRAEVRAETKVETKAEGEKTLLDAGFVACVREDGGIGAIGAIEGIPFVCSDHYGKAGLAFSMLGPSAETRGRIAAAFWDHLLARPSDLADFEERVYHPGAGVWLAYSCKAGEVRCDESEEVT